MSSWPTIAENGNAGISKLLAGYGAPPEVAWCRRLRNSALSARPKRPLRRYRWAPDREARPRLSGLWTMSPGMCQLTLSNGAGRAQKAHPERPGAADERSEAANLR